MKSDWDLSGAVDDARLFLEVGYRLTMNDVWPAWKSGSEFKARREAMMKKAAEAKEREKEKEKEKEQ